MNHSIRTQVGERTAEAVTDAMDNTGMVGGNKLVNVFVETGKSALEAPMNFFTGYTQVYTGIDICQTIMDPIRPSAG